MTGKEVVKYERPEVPAKGPTFDVFSDVQLRSLYGAVLRKYAEGRDFIDFSIDEQEYELAKKMRQELVRRVGDTWLTVWHRA